MIVHATGRRILAMAVAVVFAVAACASAFGQDDKSQLRTVHGVVVNKTEDPAPTSVVYLLNVKTQAVKTYFADDKGEYHFSGLDPNVDYEIHAELGTLMSSSRKISSYDSRRDIDVTLKLSKEKGSNN